MNQAFPIKFEASIRPVNWEKGKDYELLVLSSKVTNLTVLAQVASLERIQEEKGGIEPPRVRDIFDLWFIGQKVGRSSPMNFRGFEPRVVRRDLYKFLPEKDKRLIEQWLPK